MSTIMGKIASSEVSDKDLLDWLRDYATPRIKIMRAFLELKNLSDSVLQSNKTPAFVMSQEEFTVFRKMLNAVAKTESMAFAFAPNTDVASEIAGYLFGFMPLFVKKNAKGIDCLPNGIELTGLDWNHEREGTSY